MSSSNKFIELNTYEGDSVQLRDISGTEIRVVPQSQALSIHWPKGGFVWNHPVAITVESDEQVERVPIIDVTRIAQIVLWGLSAFFTLITIIFTFRKTKAERKEDNE
jgi:hypothetical protein